MLTSMFTRRYSVVLLPEAFCFNAEGEHIDNALCYHNNDFDNFCTVQFITQFFLIYYFTFKYRGIKGRKATFYADSHKLEMMVDDYTNSSFISFDSYYMDYLTWQSCSWILSDSENPLIIEVYAKQFQWEARYAGEDNQLGIGQCKHILKVSIRWGLTCRIRIPWMIFLLRELTLAKRA